MNYRERFMVEPGSKLKLGKIDAGFTGDYENKRQVAAELEACRQKLRDLQFRLYAENKRSLLVCLQAMDAGGKDGTIRHVLGAMNPQGCTVHAFKRPSVEEAAHDFLWRVHHDCPPKGHVSIFNRSHYEDVLVVRVHKLVPKSDWSKRYAHINAFEKLLADSGTKIVKFYLHISKDEQLDRFSKRIEDPTRHWKISESDYSERTYWDDYMQAFDDALERCSKPHAPWYIIPANRKWFRNLAVSRILVDTLEDMNPEFPAPTVDMADIKRKFHQAKNA